MNGAEFASLLATRLQPELEALGYLAEAPVIDGREYSAAYTAPDFRLVVSYEPGDDWLAIYIHRRVDRAWSEIDDRLLTPRLDDLSQRYSHRLKDAEGSRQPEGSSHDPATRRLAKALAAIPVVLPAYMDDIRSGALARPGDIPEH